MIGHRFTCGPCNHHEPGFDRARSAVRYRGAVCDLLQGFKYNGQVHAAVDLARLLEACVGVHYASVRFDAVAYVPLYRTRERARTYNQAHLLAARVARTLGLTLVPPGSVVRVRDTGTQTGLNAGARRDNVRQAFAVSQPDWMEGRTLLLVDDVMTTGATVSSAARALRDAGAAGVYVATVARG
jgi:ComF family protein